MFGDIYPTRYMRKATDTFGRLKFRLPINLPFYAKAYAPDRSINIQLKWKYRLTNTLGYFCGTHEMS